MAVPPASLNFKTITGERPADAALTVTVDVSKTDPCSVEPGVIVVTQAATPVTAPAKTVRTDGLLEVQFTDWLEAFAGKITFVSCPVCPAANVIEAGEIFNPVSGIVPPELASFV